MVWRDIKPCSPDQTFMLDMASKKAQNPFNVLDPGSTDSNDFFSSIKNGFDNNTATNNRNSFFDSPFNTSPKKTQSTLAFDQFAASMNGNPNGDASGQSNSQFDSIFSHQAMANHAPDQSSDMAKKQYSPLLGPKPESPHLSPPRLSPRGVGLNRNNPHAITPSKNERESSSPSKEKKQVSVIPDAPPVCPDYENPLENSYSFWFTQRGRGSKSKTNTEAFEHNIRYITSISSVEQFWKANSYLVQPCELNGRCDIHLFKFGIRPMWEDPENENGGKWIVRLRKGVATRCWENLILAMLGEQFMVGKEVCGAVVSIRYHTEDIVSIWNRTSNDLAVINQIRDIMKRVLNLPPNTIMEYKAHKESIRDADRRQHQMAKQSDR